MKLTLPQPFAANHLESTPSTMDAVADEPCTATTWPFVIASQQIRARGSKGRPWQAPAGNFMGSFMLPLTDTTEPQTLSLLAGLAVHQALADLAPEANLKIKWPNDIVAADKTARQRLGRPQFVYGKLGGTLVETKGAGTPNFRAVVGIGLNLEHAPDKIPNPHPQLAHAARGADIGLTTDIPTVTAAICVSFINLYTQWQTSGLAPLVDAYNAQLWRLNETTTFSTRADKSEPRNGIIRGIDATGALQLETDEGLEAITIGT